MRRGADRKAGAITLPVRGWIICASGSWATSWATTHSAGGSQHRLQRVFEFFRDQLRRYVAGEPLLNVVNKQQGF